MHPCLDCGKPITSRAQRCRSCEGKNKWKLGRLQSPLLVRGENHPNRKGLKHKDTHGYILVFKPDHPRANNNAYVFEHILVWEESHGKPVPKGWIIHHLNGIQDDNRPHNLVAMSTTKHSHILQAKAKRIQELEAQLNKKCKQLAGCKVCCRPQGRNTP